MDDKPATTKPDPNKAYLFVGITFMAAGVVFMITQTTGLWISMFVLGIVFITLSQTKAAESPEKPADETPK